MLVDSERIWDGARRDLAAAYGVPYPASATRAIMGMSAPEWSRYLRVVLGIPLTEHEIDERIVAAVATAYGAAPPFIPGAIAAVRRIATRFAVAIASSSNRVLIELLVDRAGLRDVFGAIVSAEEAARGKPAPDVYLLAADRLGVAARACGAVEDSSNGIRSAHAAGAYTVAIPNRDYPPEPDALALADVVLPDIALLEPALFPSGPESDMP